MRPATVWYGLLRSHNKNVWNKTETHHMEDLRDVIEARATAVIQAERKAGQRDGR